MIPLDQTCQVKKAWLEIASDNHSRIFTRERERGRQRERKRERGKPRENVKDVDGKREKPETEKMKRKGEREKERERQLKREMVRETLEILGSRISLQLRNCGFGIIRIRKKYSNSCVLSKRVHHMIVNKLIINYYNISAFFLHCRFRYTC